ncbi:probable serine/threonine-protein kinase WNK11 [Tanacetum coccineum]
MGTLQSIESRITQKKNKNRHYISMIAVIGVFQVLKGLDYLHTHDPCVIHRDLNCSNIYINVNTGKVKICDFGLASMVGKSHMAHFMIGTPEYMAPELYEENYNELVDIYLFGLYLLEMDTMDILYMECNCIAQIYHKVTKGVMPLA